MWRYVMAMLQVRDIDDRLYDRLKFAAKCDNRSISQQVISILKDKLPDGLLGKSNVVVELSQEDKLFRIE